MRKIMDSPFSLIKKLWTDFVCLSFCLDNQWLEPTSRILSRLKDSATLDSFKNRLYPSVTTKLVLPPLRCDAPSGWNEYSSDSDSDGFWDEEDLISFWKWSESSSSSSSVYSGHKMCDPLFSRSWYLCRDGALLYNMRSTEKKCHSSLI